MSPAATVVGATVEVESTEPEPAAYASLGTGNPLGQSGGRFPFNDSDADPSGVEISKPALLAYFRQTETWLRL